MIDAIREPLEAAGIRCETQARLRDYTTFRLGGTCPLMLHCETGVQVEQAVNTLVDHTHALTFMGGGSNILVSDHGLDEAVVRYVSETPDIRTDGDRITVSGATILDHLAAFAADNGLEGMINTSGIPGTVGGAIAGNAGAFGWQVGDVLVSARLLSRDGHCRTATQETLAFRYRYSGLRDSGDIVLEATFELTRGDRDALMAERQRILALRALKHPDLATYSTAGSFFRNIEPTSAAGRRQAAGYFLDQAGAKEMRVGGAAVFSKHANIVIKADDTCRAQDILDLAGMMAEAVSAQFDIVLEREVRPLGRFVTERVEGGGNF